MTDTTPEALRALAERLQQAGGAGEEVSRVTTWQEDLCREAADALLACAEERERLMAALQEIKDAEGKVCGNFELCAHETCRSSHAAWTIADNALAARQAEPQTKEEE